MAARYYQKKSSRETAIKGDECMSELTGPGRMEQSNKLAAELSEIEGMDIAFSDMVPVNVEESNNDTTECDEILLEDESALEETSTNALVERTSLHNVLNLDDVDRDLDGILNPTLSITPLAISDIESGKVGKRKSTENVASLIQADDIELKKEDVQHEVKRLGFSPEEDAFIKEGMEKYKLSKTKWSDIVQDRAYSFHPSRCRNTIRMRAARLKPRTKSIVPGKVRSVRSKGGDVSGVQS